MVLGNLKKKTTLFRDIFAVKRRYESLAVEKYESEKKRDLRVPMSTGYASEKQH